MTNDRSISPTAKEGIAAASISASPSASNNMGSAQTGSAAREDPFAAVLALARVTLTPTSASAPVPVPVPSPVSSPISSAAASPAASPGPVDQEDNSEHPRRSHHTGLPQISLEGPDIVSQDESGRYVVRSRFFPSPAERDAPYRGQGFITVMRGEGRDVEFEDILPSDLPEASNPHDDRDERDVRRIEDVFEYDNPTLDTPLLFPVGIECSRQLDGIVWEPHRIIGPDPSARALISTSETFVPNTELQSGFPSSTSRGHQPKVPRPSQVGAGWGDHDKFQEWQRHGRALTKNMAGDKAWAHEDPEVLRFVGDGEDIVVTEGLEKNDPQLPESYADRQRPRTVLEQFQTRGYGEATRGGGQRGRGQRGRGQHPGGGRGRGGRLVLDNPGMW
ncbi:hypothetical protein CEP51_003398 [Fusarium floridanum]|uniref:Uncharacterized protein n=1 Tax=Fusarium floridanum TaxID=1325733 RepID=A0A428S665_9HYPO|nr:hypothetical protein CEP51_003398 [Fusarium floridanum]